MHKKTIDVLTVGNAIVDVLAHADDDFLVERKIMKGVMQLIDEARAEELYDAMGPATIMSGGSAANTAVGAAMLGAKVAFIGKVRDDESGRLFAHDLKAVKVTYDVPPATEGATTARCFIMVTPDGERSMNTFLGASQNLTVVDVSPATVAAAEIVYLEGYLWDPPQAKDAFRKVMSVAHQAGGKVAFTLSDTFCVDRYRNEFLNLIRDGSLDIVFANVGELKSLYGTSDENAAIAALRQEGVLGIVTRSEHGALLVSRDETRSIPAVPVDKVVDTTGAGDLYAAGFLAGLARGLTTVDSARLGALAAAEIIGHMGPRPQVDLLNLAQQNGFFA